MRSAPLADSELKRYRFRAPGQAASYSNGYPRMMELRAEAEYKIDRAETRLARGLTKLPRFPEPAFRQNACNQTSAMAASIQIRNVPDELHRALKARAAMAGMSLSDYLMDYMRRLASRPTPEEMRERLSRREPVRVSEPAADVLRRERDGEGPKDERHQT